MEKEQPRRLYFRNSSLSAAVRGDRVIMVDNNSSDKTQHWILAYDVGMLTDEEGRRAFALVNRTTGQAMVNRDDKAVLELAPYSGHVAVEISRLWSLGKRGPDGFSSVRVLKDINYTLNAFGGIADQEGSIVGTYSTEHNDNSQWKIDPINE